MNDMRQAITPKSDQTNSDDLIGGPQTITVTKVTIIPGEQPVAIHFAGDAGKPYKPCKSMSRILVAMWGPDAGAYAGRSMTIYRDPSVKWGGMEVGGIRISHLSDIKRETVMALTMTKGNKKPFTVRPLQIAQVAAPATGPTIQGEARTAPPAPEPEFAMLAPDSSERIASSPAKWQAWCISAIAKIGPDGISGWWREMAPHIEAMSAAGHHDEVDAVTTSAMRQMQSGADDASEGEAA